MVVFNFRLMGVWPECMSVQDMCSVLTDWKREGVGCQESGSLELQTSVSHHVGAGNPNSVLRKNSKYS